MSPMSPLSIICLAYLTAGMKRYVSDIIFGTGFSLNMFLRGSHSARFIDSGFSTLTGLPAFIAAIAMGTCK